MKLSLRLALGYARTKIKLLSAISKKKAARYAFRLFCTPPRRHKPALPAIFENAESLSFMVDNIMVRGWRWNHPAQKKIHIIHGFESSSANFEQYIRLFIKNGYEVIAFDAPAHGHSDSRSVTAPLYAKMIKSIYEKFGPVDGWLAHSFGGLALSLALESIPHTKDHRVVLIAPATETKTAIDSFFRLLKISPALHEPFENCIINAGGNPSSWYSITRAIKNIHAIILWIHDENDDTTPLSDLAAIRSQNHAHVTFLITKGLGHRRIYRDQSVIERVVAFL